MELTSNSIVIQLEEEASDYYTYFTDTEWKLKRNKIYSPDIKKNKWISKPYFEELK